MNSLPADRKIIFVPDMHLGSFVAEQTGRDLVLWQGYCPTHVVITVEDIASAKAKQFDAVVMTHPECPKAVRDISDEILSTGQMLRFAKSSPAKNFIIATEIGIIHTLRKQNPDATFIAASSRAVCPNMKKITLEKIVFCLEDMQYKVQISPEISTRARQALDRMVEVLPAK